MKELNLGVDSLGGIEQAFEDTSHRQGHGGAQDPADTKVERHGAAANMCPLQVESSRLHFQNF